MGFVNSDEFQAKYGALNNADFVSLLYNNVLGRAADGDGLAYWTGQLGGAQTRTQVVNRLLRSQEYINGTRAGTDAYMRSAMAVWTTRSSAVRATTR